jgi:hypothetical protein
MLHTLGDSHCWHSWLKIPDVKVHLIGPMTMHSFGLSKPIVTMGIPEQDTVVYCWGEIDCRCHVHKYPPYNDCIDTLVANYIEAIKKNQITHPNALIFNIPPPPRRGKVIEEKENPGFPFLGTDRERLNYVKYMNKKLKETGYKIVDIYKNVSDCEGFLNPEQSDDQVHISDEKPIVEWLKKEEYLK